MAADGNERPLTAFFTGRRLLSVSASFAVCLSFMVAARTPTNGSRQANSSATTADAIGVTARDDQFRAAEDVSLGPVITTASESIKMVQYIDSGHR